MPRNDVNGIVIARCDSDVAIFLGLAQFVGLHKQSVAGICDVTDRMADC